MNKKWLAVILIITLSFTLLTSCAKKDGTEDAVASVADKESTSDNEQQKPADNGSDDKDDKPSESDDKKEQDTDGKKDQAVSDKKPSKPDDKKDQNDNNQSAESDDKQSEDTDNTQAEKTDCTKDEHAFGQWQTVRKATCIWEGESKRVCSNCSFTEKKTIPESAHTEVVDAAVESTCSKNGKTEGKHCSFCFTVTVEQKELERKPHNFKNGETCECGEYVDSLKFTVMSQNMRCADDGEGKMLADRSPRFKLLVEMYKPDIIGTQETTSYWNKFFSNNLKEYGSVGCSREGRDATSGEWGTILYRLDRFELIDSDTFWLSNTPDKVSRVSGSKCNRICTWALLKDKNTGKTFVMANTHLDHGTDEVREQQMDILLKELSELTSKYPLILTGDFNATPESKAYSKTTSTLLDARTTSAENKSLIKHTFDSYGSSSGKIIDYCFYNKKLSARWYKVANDKFDGYVSDHYAIVTEFAIK